jgi:hypothetical protein
MSTLAAATDRFLSVIDTHRNLQELQEGTLAFHQQIPFASQDEINAALHKLLPTVRTAHLVPMGSVALSCGALVEFGGDPAICGAALLDRLPDLLRGVGAFLREVHERANVQEYEEPDLNQLINLHINDILESNPEAAFAYLSQRPLTLGTIAHLSRSKPLRALARSRPELVQWSMEADALKGETSFLTTMLRVLDDAALTVLHPGEQKGFEVRISGLADNFQLHTLLADALIGDPEQGLLGGQKPDPRVVAAARDTILPPNTRLTTTGAFNLWNWPGLLPDGTLPTGTTGGWWIWNEGTPADILTFDGKRVILLGPPPYSQSWKAGRQFGHMRGELTVEHILAPDVVRDWLARLASAPRPQPPTQ